MTIQQGNSQATPEGQPAGESTDINDLEGLLGEPQDIEEPAEEAPPQEQEEAPAEEAPPEEPKTTDETKVALDDGREVSVRELKETFSTFTRKTQELAETQRTTLTQAREAVATYAERQAQELHLVSERIEQLVAGGMSEQQLMHLAYTDPDQYRQISARLDVARNVRAGIQQQVQQLMQQAQQQREQAQQEQQQAHQELLRTEGERLSAQKWWNDDFRNKAVAFARKHGIPEQIVRNVPYAGFVEITRKAMLYDEAMARTKAGKQPPKQPAMTPGASPARGALTQTKQVSASYERARKTGDRADIGRFLDQVL